MLGLSPSQSIINQAESLSRKTAALLLIGFWVLAFWLTHSPADGDGWLKALLKWLPVKSDKLAHAGIYFALAGLLANFIGRWTRSTPILATTTFLVTMLYATIDEALQAFVPSRTPDFYDLVADAVGSFLGTSVFIVLRSSKAKLQSASPAEATSASVNSDEATESSQDGIQ